jgi:uncharacterized membrane protein
MDPVISAYSHTELIVGDTNLISGLSKTRIEALTDGIFAIAMTLMVFDIKLPPVAQMGQWNLRHELIQLWPRFLAYVISFVMLGVYWVGHHNQYHYIRRTDRPFLWINIFFLMGVSLIPFSTGLLGQFPEDRTALGVYGLNLIMVGGFLYAHWSYAARDYRLVERDIDPSVVRLVKYLIVMGPAVSILAICASFVSPRLSLAIFALIPLLYLIPGRIDYQWLHGDTDTRARPRE